MTLPKILATALLAAGLVTGMSSAGVHIPFESAASAVHAGATDGAYGHLSAAAPGSSASAEQRAVLTAVATDDQADAAVPPTDESGVVNQALGAARAEAETRATIREAVSARSRAATAAAAARARADTRAPTSAAPTPAAPITSPAPAKAAVVATTDGYGCADALAYLSQHAAPGFTFECPGYAEGHQAMTCVNMAGVCSGEKLIAINDPCRAAYMNEASNSFRAIGESTAPVDPFGSCS